MSAPNLSGQIALVTGATSGLGYAMAQALSEAGATVIITSRSQARANEAAAQLKNAIGLEMDSSQEDSVKRGIAHAWQKFGPIDLLINNAGLGMKTVNPNFMSQPQPFWDVPSDKFQLVITTNLTGYFLVTKEVVPRMLERGQGKIVNISMNHSTMNRKGFVPYGPSRAGAEALSRIMAADLEDTPIRLNILLPGGATATGMIPDEIKKSPATSLLEPSIMGPPIVWLASSKADSVHNERIVATEFSSWLKSHS